MDIFTLATFDVRVYSLFGKPFLRFLSDTYPVLKLMGVYKNTCVGNIDSERKTDSSRIV